jgi:hypothetical protein
MLNHNFDFVGISSDYGKSRRLGVQGGGNQTAEVAEICEAALLV